MATFSGAAQSSFPVAGDHAAAEAIPTYQLSSRWRRFFAGLIDIAVVSVPIGIVVFASIVPLFETYTRVDGTVAVTPEARQAIEDRLASVLPIAALVPFVVATFFTGMFRGQTLAKMMLGIRVVRVRDGLAPGMKIAAWRTFVSQSPQFASTILAVVGIALPGLVGFALTIASILIIAWILWDPFRRGLHDRAAKTVVINTRSEPEPELEWRPASAQGSW